jgi:hypothetical protein
MSPVCAVPSTGSPASRWRCKRQVLVSPPGTCTAAGWRLLPTYLLSCCTAAPRVHMTAASSAGHAQGGLGLLGIYGWCNNIVASPNTPSAHVLQLDCSSAAVVLPTTPKTAQVVSTPLESVQAASTSPVWLYHAVSICMLTACAWSLAPYLGVSTTAYALQGSCLTSNGCRGAAAAAACAAYTNGSTGAPTLLHVLP